MEAGVTQLCCDVFARSPVKDTPLLAPIAVPPTQNPGDGLMFLDPVSSTIVFEEVETQRNQFPIIGPWLGERHYCLTRTWLFTTFVPTFYP